MPFLGRYCPNPRQSADAPLRSELELPQMRLRSPLEVRGAPQSAGTTMMHQNLFDLFAGRGGACPYPCAGLRGGSRWRRRPRWLRYELRCRRRRSRELGRQPRCRRHWPRQLHWEPRQRQHWSWRRESSAPVVMAASAISMWVMATMVIDVGLAQPRTNWPRSPSNWSRCIRPRLPQNESPRSAHCQTFELEGDLNEIESDIAHDQPPLWPLALRFRPMPNRPRRRAPRATSPSPRTPRRAQVASRIAPQAKARAT